MTALSTEQRKRIVDLIEGWECAARLTDEIVKAFEPELVAFSSSTSADGVVHDIRLIRSVLDERNLRDRYTKDAEALRAVLAIVDEKAPGHV